MALAKWDIFRKAWNMDTIFRNFITLFHHWHGSFIKLSYDCQTVFWLTTIPLSKKNPILTLKWNWILVHCLSMSLASLHLKSNFSVKTVRQECKKWFMKVKWWWTTWDRKETTLILINKKHLMKCSAYFMFYLTLNIKKKNRTFSECLYAAAWFLLNQSFI